MSSLPIFGPDLVRAKRFKKLCQRLGIEGVHPCVLRHTCASLIVEVTGQLTLAQAQLGHSDPRMTMRYAHFTPEMGDEAACALERHRATSESGRR